MEPILFIHGYSAESADDKFDSVKAIYGDQKAKPNLNLPDALRDALGAGAPAVFEIDLSRYVSLDNGVNLDDIARALELALRADFPHLLTGAEGFNVIVHSTGALVVRNWLRLFSAKPSKIKRLIYLAGANFGSGWAHIGKGQLAQWARFVFEHGADAGIKVLDALELGSNQTLDLHLSFLQEGCSMVGSFGVREAVVIGSQPHVSWFEVPVRYAKEDGSDGVVRVSACNVNFHYLRLAPRDRAHSLGPEKVDDYLNDFRARKPDLMQYYEIADASRPGDVKRPEVPFAIPYQASHSGKETGIVSGAAPRVQVLRLLKTALNTAPADWQGLVQTFADETANTLDRVTKFNAPKWWQKWIFDTRKQYDAHAQVVFRLRDQDGRPVEHYDIFFNSVSGKRDTSLPFNSLIEDKHLNSHPNIFVLYLRTSTYQGKMQPGDVPDALNKNWVMRVPQVNGCILEVSAVEPETGLVRYLPMRFEFTPEQLTSWLVGHRTTIIDIELLRLPQRQVYTILRDR
jgi:pimeloyl-ACP methyl ester carboxylesterase